MHFITWPIPGKTTRIFFFLLGSEKMTCNFPNFFLGFGT
uniref:Uncharacterized protein n=1 Tax=Anguilla anguilla TaxID=7936 RepID=A0A0E9VKP9_ANGAN